MAQRYATLIACLAVLLVAGGQINADNSKEIADAINGFGLDLYKELSKTNGNLVCSGYSASTVLNMLLAGARKDTEKELRKALYYDELGLTRRQAQDAYHEILTKQRNNQNGYDLDVANSMWIHSGYPVLTVFKNIIRNKFYAEEQEVNFGSPLATDKINTWVSEETNNKIPKLFDDTLDADTRLVLVNAMYFKGTWEVKFNESFTKPYPFKSESTNTKKDIAMMNVHEEFAYHEDRDLNAEFLELPYDGDDVSMVIVLPKAHDGLSSLQDQLTVEKLTRALDNLYVQEVRVKIPKFEISSTLPLNEVLQGLGIQKAFTRGADLSGIDGTQNLYVSDAIQKAIIEVNEEGTVAAAASGISIQFRMALNDEVYFTADHPFLYFIRHKPTGLFLFMGRFAEA